MWALVCYYIIPWNRITSSRVAIMVKMEILLIVFVLVILVRAFRYDCGGAGSTATKKEKQNTQKEPPKSLKYTADYRGNKGNGNKHFQTDSRMLSPSLCIANFLIVIILIWIVWGNNISSVVWVILSENSLHHQTSTADEDEKKWIMWRPNDFSSNKERTVNHKNTKPATKNRVVLSRENYKSEFPFCGLDSPLGFLPSSPCWFSWEALVSWDVSAIFSPLFSFTFYNLDRKKMF